MLAKILKKYFIGPVVYLQQIQRFKFYATLQNFACNPLLLFCNKTFTFKTFHKTTFSYLIQNNSVVILSRSIPPEPIHFEFASELLGDGVGSLQAGQLAVDSLTIDTLRQKLADTEHRLSDVSSELKSKQNLLNQHETEITNIQKNSQDTNILTRFVYHSFL